MAETNEGRRPHGKGRKPVHWQGPIHFEQAVQRKSGRTLCKISGCGMGSYDQGPEEFVQNNNVIVGEKWRVLPRL